MEKDNIEALIAQCPLIIRTNDGREYFVEKAEFISVGDYTTAILFSREGKMLHTFIANINITSIEPRGELAEN
jgi:hypothetical protein